MTGSNTTRSAFTWALALALLGFGLLTACAHSETASDTAPTPAANSADASPVDARKESRSKLPKTIAPMREGGPPLAGSPVGLLKPHAVESIQKQLVAQGKLDAQHESGRLDDATRAALRQFQQEHTLPATGVPDDLTVRKLGLNSGDIFRSALDN